MSFPEKPTAKTVNDLHFIIEPAYGRYKTSKEPIGYLINIYFVENPSKFMYIRNNGDQVEIGITDLS